MNYTNRQRNEKEFHDRLATSLSYESIDIMQAFSVGAQENRLARTLFGDLSNKRILDLGCGYGETAIFWALCGAHVDGVDISKGMVALARKLATKYRVLRQCHFQQMAAEKLLFPARDFDFVFGQSVLHHVDICASVDQVRRVLKKEGMAIFVEPLSYNPLINLYRRLADRVRTRDETPLTFKDVNKLKSIFTSVEHREYHFLTQFIFIWFFVAGRIHPNQERYWKKLLQVRGGLKILLRILILADKIILTIFPPLRYLCWNTVIILKK